MTMTTSEAYGQGAIHHASSGEPVLREALCAHVYLEPFVGADAVRLERLHDDVGAWIGDALTWTWGDLKSPVMRFEPEQLRALAQDVARGKGRLLFMGDGSSRDVAPCWGYRFASGQATPAAPMLVAFQLVAPIDTNPTEFAARLGSMLEPLRVRWANIGYGYSLWGPRGASTPSAVRATHAQRHVGFDAGEDLGADFVAFHAKLRTINWCTILGAALEREWRSAGGELTLERVGPHALVRASELPLRGDRERNDLLPDYRRVDEALRPIRAATCASQFGWMAWGKDATDTWLRRFE